MLIKSKSKQIETHIEIGERVRTLLRGDTFGEIAYK